MWKWLRIREPRTGNPNPQRLQQKKKKKKVKDPKERKAKRRLVMDSKVVKRHCRGSKA